MYNEKHKRMNTISESQEINNNEAQAGCYNYKLFMIFQAEAWGGQKLLEAIVSQLNSNVQHWN